MSYYSLAVVSDHRPEDVPGVKHYQDVVEAAEHGADVVAMWADRVMTAKADLTRWRDILINCGTIEFDDGDGEPWSVEVRRVDS